MDYENVIKQNTRRTTLERVQREWMGLKELPDIPHPAVGGFCDRKQIKYESLRNLGVRYDTRKSGAIVLAYPRYDRRGQVSEIRYRDLSDTDPKRNRWSRKADDARTLATVLGPAFGDEWAVVEGETDQIRLHEQEPELSVICLAGAHNANAETLSAIPRGATVYAATDDDDAGDKAAARIAALFPNTIRVSPEPYKDWCEWWGSRDELRELFRKEREYALAGGRPVSLSSIMRKWNNRPREEGIWSPFDLVEMRRGHMMMLGGYTGDGKSTLALQWAIQAARQGIRVLFFSLEMTWEDFADRCSRALEPEEDLPISFVFGVLRDFLPLVEMEKPDIAFVDHVHHVSSDRKELEEIARAIKNTAIVGDCPIITLAQLTETRGGDRVPFPRPNDSKLRETAVLSHVSDVTMYVWRHRDDDGEATADADIFLGKKRHMPPGSVDTVFARLTETGFVERGHHHDEPAEEEDELGQVVNLWE